MAIADLLFVLVCLPPTAVSYVGDWPTGDIGCKLNQYLIPVAMYVSIYTLVLLSLDRYLAVVYPVKSISLRTGRNTGLGLYINLHQYLYMTKYNFNVLNLILIPLID